MTEELSEHIPDDVVAMRALLRDRPLHRAGEPIPPERILAFVEGELSSDEAQQLAEATACDPALAAELRITAEIVRARREAARAAAPEAIPTRAANGGPRALWTAVAAIAAALVVAWIVRAPAPTGGGSQEMRAGTEAAAITSRVPVEGLPRDAFDLSWEGGPPGATWDVHVTTQQLTVVHQSFDLKTPSARVPRTALRDIPGGTPLLWRVTATAPDGRRTSSRGFTVVLR